MTIKNGTTMKVVMPGQLYAALWQEAKDAGVTMADLVRLAVKSRYEHLGRDELQRIEQEIKTETT